MPHTHSAKKELRKNIKRKAQNEKRKNLIKSLRKEIKTLVLNKKVEEAKTLLPKLYKAADKAAKVNAIHKNKAARIKAQMANLLMSK